MKNRAIAIGIPIGVVVLLLLLVTSTFSHRAYEEPVVTRFGEIVEPASLHWGNWKLKLPTPIETVHLIDRRVRSFRTRNQEYTLRAAEQGLAGSEKLQIQMYCHWQVTDGKQFFRRLYDDESLAEQKISEKMVDMLRAEIQGRTIDEFFNLIEDEVKQRDMEVRVRERVNVECRQEQLGLEVASVGFYRISFSPLVFQSICNAMVTEQIQRATAYEKQGEEEAARIRAAATGQAKILVAEAEADAERITKEAQAEAEALYRDAIQLAPVLWGYDEGLKTAVAVLKDRTEIVLSPKDWAMLRAILDPDSFAEPGEATPPPATRPATGP